jgi:predicted rRNA methylase YqxC with S4 and FtsJ domains
VIEEVNNAARELGLEVIKVIESPITGADGNVEYLAHYKI